MSDQDRISARAYELWEAAGRPEGQHEEHWEQARREIAEGEAAQDNAAPSTAGTLADEGSTTPPQVAAAADPVGASRIVSDASETVAPQVPSASGEG